MVPCLSHFPSLCLEAIFKYAPLVELLQSIGLVCTNWRASQHTDLTRRRRVVIVRDNIALQIDYRGFIFSQYESDLIGRVRREDGSPWHRLESLEQIQFDQLIVPNAFWNAVPRTIPSLLDQLSGTTQLVFILSDNHPALPQVVHTIDQCFAQLVDLKLKVILSSAVAQQEAQFDQNVANLFTCLDRLASLRHLRLCLDLPNLRIRPPMAFLSRLATLAIEIYSFGDWVLSELNEHWSVQVGASPIELYNTVQMGALLAQVNTRLDGQFSAMSVTFYVCHRYFTQHDYDRMILQMRQFCTRFCSLTKLKLELYRMPMAELARGLSQLRQLVQLDLKILEHFQQMGPLVEQQPTDRVLSVRLLILHITTASHRHTEQLFIPEIFPNVQVIRLFHHAWQCTDCEIGGIAYRADFSARIVECKRLGRRSFWRCPTLHTIQLGGLGDSGMITVNEL